MTAACEAIYEESAFLLMEEAQEGTNIDAAGAWLARLRDVGKLKSEVNELSSRRDYKGAAAKCREIVQYFSDLESKVSNLNDSKGSRLLINAAVILLTYLGTRVAGRVAGGIAAAGISRQGERLLDDALHASSVKDFDKIAGRGAGMIVGSFLSVLGVLAARIGAGVAVWKFLKSKGFKKRDDIAKIDMTENDKNKLIQAIRQDCHKGQQLYTAMAEDFEQASSSASEAWLLH